MIDSQTPEDIIKLVTGGLNSFYNNREPVNSIDSIRSIAKLHGNI